MLVLQYVTGTPGVAKQQSSLVLPAVVHALLRETDIVYALSTKQECLYSITYSPRVKLYATGKLGRSGSARGERSIPRGKHYFYGGP